MKKGFGPALALAPHGAIQMVLYEEMKRWSMRTSIAVDNEGSHGSTRAGMMLPFIWGVLSKLIAIILTYPVQVSHHTIQASLQRMQSIRSLQQMIDSPYAKQSMVNVVRVSGWICAI
eukprot:Selendium_serpulae@DN5366_c0_g1_i5.p2